MKIKFKKLTPTAHIPVKIHPTDAGFDLYADRVDYDGSKYIYHTGIAMEIPKGYVGLIYPRSSICNVNAIMTNHVGVIDSGYRGDVMLTFKNYNSPQATINFKPYKIGERIGQIIIIPYPEIEFTEVNELSESDRGEGGHGSSGK